MPQATVTQVPSSQPAMDTVRQQYNLLQLESIYHRLNGLASTTIATLPVCARGTTASKVKTTADTVLRNAGALNAFAATDDAWTLTGGVLAVSSFRRYLLLADAADARSVQASTDAATAAACVWGAPPANGLAIVGILTVATDATHTFTPATTLLSAAGITDTYIDGTDIGVYLSQQVGVGI